jgi:hypothetical protein
MTIRVIARSRTGLEPSVDGWHYVGWGDPAMGGLTAALGSVYTQLDSSPPGEVWTKTGPSDTDWTRRSRSDTGMVNVKDYGARGDGIADDTAAIQRAMNAGRCALFPPGTYRTTAPLVQSFPYQMLFGWSEATTVIACASGYALKNFPGADAAPDDGLDGLRLVGLWFKGGQPDRTGLDAPTNDWFLNSGRTKRLTTTHLNVGLKLKRIRNLVIERCRVTNFHRAIVQNAGSVSTVRKTLFQHCEIGYYCENGSEWGGAAWKNTTMTVTENTFANCWFGAYTRDLVDGSAFVRNVFEPCNTAHYVVDGGNARFNDYYERCYEGLVFGGGFAGTFLVDAPVFAGRPGNFWGRGRSIHVLENAGTSCRVLVRAGSHLGGGGLQNDRPTAARLELDRPLDDITGGAGIYVRGGLPGFSSDRGDANVTVNPATDPEGILFATPLTANRTLTLGTIGAAIGARFRVVRAATATGAFTLDVGGLKRLTAAGQWCEVVYTGAGWQLVASGVL